eukprot:3857474-Amphidinium_carterae.1
MNNTAVMQIEKMFDVDGAFAAAEYDIGCTTWLEKLPRLESVVLNAVSELSRISSYGPDPHGGLNLNLSSAVQ